MTPAGAVPGLSIELQPEPVILRLCLWAEARGEPVIGRLAILYVLENRAIHRGSTLKTEVLRPRQFSSFNDDDPNRPLLLDAHTSDRAGWAAVDAICSLYESHATNNPVADSTHYYRFDMEHPPTWGRGNTGWKERMVLGHHVFGIAGERAPVTPDNTAA